MKRQKRVLNRDEPPAIQFIVDQATLYRLTGNAEVMAEQLTHLLALAAMPRVVVQLLPQVAHSATSSELIIADDCAYCEHLAAGGVYDGDSFTRLETIMDTIASECYRASESQTIIREAIERWTKLQVNANRVSAEVLAVVASQSANSRVKSLFAIQNKPTTRTATC
jgi:hypothetical protein